jgi:hypothetical protein
MLSPLKPTIVASAGPSQFGPADPRLHDHTIQKPHPGQPVHPGSNGMSDRNEKRKKRYAEDPEYRERVLASNRAYNKANSKKLNARRRERRATDSEFREREKARRRLTARDVQLKHEYGLSRQDYDYMVQCQDGRCAICDRKAELCVDHCHANGMVRLLLCRSCNLGLGYFKDNPELLSRGKYYVELFQKLAAHLKAAGHLKKEPRPVRKRKRKKKAPPQHAC